MTIKTLSFIHKLLEEEEKRLTTAVNLARDAYYAAEEAEADNAASLKARYESLRTARYAAGEALREFEDKEW